MTLTEARDKLNFLIEQCALDGIRPSAVEFLVDDHQEVYQFTLKKVESSTDSACFAGIPEGNYFVNIEIV